MIAVSDTAVVVPYSNDEGEIFVPHSFALAKLKIASSEYVELKRNYEEYIIELKESHEQHCQQNQRFYEEYIREVKKKAKYHVEGQRDLNGKMEIDFQNQVANSEEIIERLRDQLTDLRLAHQEDSRALRKQFSEAKDNETKLRDLSKNEFTHQECAGVMSDLLLRVEMFSLMSDQENERGDASKRFSTLTADVTRMNDDAKALQKDVRNEKDTEFQCKEVMQLMLHQMETREWQQEKDMLKTAEKMIALLSANSSEAELLKARECSRLEEELQVASESHTDFLRLLSQQHETEVGLLLQRYEEAVAVHEEHIQIQHDITVVLEVEGCLQRLVTKIEINQDSLLAITSTNDTAMTAATAVHVRENDREKIQILEKKGETDNNLLISQLKDEIIQLRGNLDQALVSACLDSVLTRVCDREAHKIIDYIPSKIEYITETKLCEDSLLKERITFLEEQVSQLIKAATAASALEKKAPPISPHEIKSSDPSVPVIAPDSNEDKAKETTKEEELRISLIRIQEELSLAVASLTPMGEEKEMNKSMIQRWATDFTKENGRDPTDDDKKAVRSKYQAYQKSTKTLKSTITLVSSLDIKIKDIEEELLKLTAERIAEEGAHVSSTDESDFGTVTPLGSPSKMEIQPSFKRAASFKRAPSLVNINTDGKDLEAIKEENNAAIEGLEDKIYQLQQDLEVTFSANAKGAEDNLLLTEQLAALIKEKRTDIVKRYEEEIATLRAEGATLQSSLTELKAFKARNEKKIAELNERAELAEGELKTRDANEQKGLNPKDEKTALKLQVGKQRDDIVMKAKAATAGWNAAAASDERLDLDVDKAYRKGRDESVKQHSEDMRALNASLETKETRITDIMVNINIMEKKVRDAEDRERKAVEAGRLAWEEAQEAIATFGTGEGGGAGAEKDIEVARDQLDAAQEELVDLSEKYDELISSLDIARQKGELLEQLVANFQANAKAAQLQTSVALSRSGGADGDVNGMLTMIKDCFIKGAVLNKNNKKDACFDLYAKTCDDLILLLFTPALRTMMQEGRAQGGAQSMGGTKKERGGVVLKKTLDRLMTDLQQPGTRRIEEEMKRDSAQQLSAAGEDALISGLNDQLAILVRQEKTIEGRQEKRTDVTIAGEPSSVIDLPTSNSSSLLQRAKRAEDKVEMLKKQMAAMARDKEMNSEGNGNDNREGGEGDAVGQSGSDNRSLSASTPGTVAVKGRVLESKGATKVTGGGDVNPAEVRKLKKRIQELEGQVQSGGGTGGGDKKTIVAAANAEKALNRKIKDMESAFRKEKSALESRVVKAEATLEVSSASLPLITSERDQLRAQVKKFKGQDAEIEALKGQGQECKTLKEELLVKGQEFDVLTEQYKKENALRKKYKNELEDLKGAIRVYARCRPMVTYEREKGCKQVVEFVDETSLKVTAGRGEKEYELDTVFDQKSTQVAVFEDTRRLVESFMDGFNVCLFAYGQTGSGKTFTMTGSPSEPGLTPRAVSEIYRLIQDRPHCDCTVTTYFVELYNDQLVDLLWIVDSKDKSNNDRPGQGGEGPPHLDIKMDDKKMVYVKGVVIKEAETADSLLELFSKGNAERHTGATNMNAESSRSHSIFSIMVESYDRNTKKTVRGKLSLVDLAGSERAEKTGGNAERLKEGQSINKSLSALGDVMAALSEGGKTFIPYRNNKLTQLMQDSLGGNSKTLMFVNFSPADYNADETVTSLNFAARVKKVVNNASKSAEGEEVVRLRATIKRLIDKTGGVDDAEQAVE